MQLDTILQYCPFPCGLKNSPPQVHNLIIHVKSGKTFLDPKHKFETAAELFQHHMKNPLIINEKEISLTRGVGLTEWEFEHKHVNVGRLIGKGQYGEVRKGTLKLKSGTVVTVAIKSCKMDCAEISKEIIKEVMKEARLMRELNHPNVVKLYGVGVLERPLYILLEYVAGGALKSYLRKNKDFITKEERSQMALGAAWGIEHLHKKNILHRDIAARNCLYDQDSAVKISDFGLSRIGAQYKMKTSKKMPIRWMAPESIATFMFTRKTDVYSFGVLIYEIYSSQDPYTETGPGAVRKKIVDGEFNVFPIGTPDDLIKFVKEKMWNKDPEQRADMNKVVEFFERFAGLTASAESVDIQRGTKNAKEGGIRGSDLSEEKKRELFLKLRKRTKNAPMKTQFTTD
uniref:Protein kinase domain-containing protein n=1 Tax=Angiostrongylus cantonensis TaxID=6313 RepID=A0A158P8X8_ANGCA